MTVLDLLAPGASSAVAAPAVTAAPAVADLGTLGGATSTATAVSGNIVVGYSDTASGAQLERVQRTTPKEQVLDSKVADSYRLFGVGGGPGDEQRAVPYVRRQGWPAS